MIQDLTADGDFSGQRGLAILRHLPGLDPESGILPDLDEPVLTGTAADRAQKRYWQLDKEQREDTCDCCGKPLRIRPWDFADEAKTICESCEKALEYLHEESQDGHLFNQVIDDSFRVRAIKPWDIPEDERDNAIDNVLLWD